MAENNSNPDLIEAVKARDLKEVNRLLAAGADPNVQETSRTSNRPRSVDDFSLRTPLIIAVENGDIDIVKALINAGADVNKTDTYFNKPDDYFKYTPLIVAAGRGDTELVKLLITAGAKLDIRTPGGTTALSAAYGNEAKLPTFQALINAGADPNIRQSYDTYLITSMTLYDGDIPYLKALFSSPKLNLNIPVQYGKTIGQLAVEGKISDKEIIDILFNASAFDSSIIIKDGKSIQKLREEGISDTELLKLLLESPAVDKEIIINEYEHPMYQKTFEQLVRQRHVLRPTVRKFILDMIGRRKYNIAIGNRPVPWFKPARNENALAPRRAAAAAEAAEAKVKALREGKSEAEADQIAAVVGRVPTFFNIPKVITSKVIGNFIGPSNVNPFGGKRRMTRKRHTKKVKRAHKRTTKAHKRR
jgi:ankyrin repeat protein